MKKLSGIPDWHLIIFVTWIRAPACLVFLLVLSRTWIESTYSAGCCLVVVGACWTTSHYCTRAWD